MKINLHGWRPVHKLELLLLKILLPDGDDKSFQGKNVYSIGKERQKVEFI